MTTDQQGRFQFLSLAPDTYTLSFEKAGYQSATQGGITVQADQNVSISLQGTRALQTIGRTAARANSALVRPGQTASVYSVNAAQQAAGASLGGGANLNQAYSAIASVPGVVVPLNQPGWGTSIFIRGGDYTQTGNEVDGIPINRSFDQYASGQLSSLGNQEVQVYTGQAPADAQAIGLAGFVNQVIKTGTYPGTITGTIGLGTPHKYNHANLELAGASPNRLFSYYLGTGGYSETFRNIDQFNGAGYLQRTGQGSIINYIAAGCGVPGAPGAPYTYVGAPHPTVGCYQNVSPFLGGVPLGPNGFAYADTLWGFQTDLNDRETIANLHFGIPHKKDGNHDDIQVLYDYGNTKNYPNDSHLDWGKSLNDVLNGTFSGITNNGTCPAQASDAFTPTGPQAPTTCAGPVIPRYQDQNQYTGPVGTALSAGDLGRIQRFAFPSSPSGRAWGGPSDPARQDGETNAFAIVKAQYQHNIADKGYIRLYGYTLYSDRLDNGLNGIFENFVGAFSPDYQISSHSRGTVLNVGYQLTPEHLVNFNAGYVTSNTVRYRNDVPGSGAESPVAYLVSSANPTGGCYSAAAVLTTCANAAQYRLPGVNSLGGSLVPRAGSPIVGTESALSCGGAPCEYLVVNDGRIAAKNTVRPKFFNAALSDTWKPSSRLSIDLSLRTDTFSYDMQNTSTIGNQLFVNEYNARHCINGTSITTRAAGAPCALGVPTNLSANSPNLTYADVLQPRIGATLTLNPYNVLRASYGRFVQPPETSSVQATNVQASVPNANFYGNFGFNSYARPVIPEISYNTDFSWEHQVKGTDLSTRITPFNRKTQNEFATVLVDLKTNFVAFVNGQNRTASGLELAVSKGDFAREGFAGSLAYTYTHTVNHYKVFPTGGSFVAGINQSVQAYNAYTSFCGSHPTDTRCQTTSGTVAAPCYANGAPDPTCAAGSVANPYWNAPVQNLLDPTAGYPAYNQQPGFGSGTSTSYVIPHVASLIVQYKKGPWKFTPSLQFQGGARYGSPVAIGGVAPDTCNPLPGLPSATGDPRYTATGAPAPGGAGYDASTCTGFVNIPNPLTKHFDGIGEFRQPNVLNGNLQVSYDINKRFTLQITGANLLATCWGGSNVPWAIGGRLGCSYSAGGPAGNFYNPGDVIQPGSQYPYLPVLAGSLQSVATNSAAPPQVYFELKMKKL